MTQETKNNINSIRMFITHPAILEQMAEECAELSKALLKKARKIRNENYTPLDMETIDNNITEEFTDVAICAEVLNLKINMDMFNKKLNRWVDRNVPKPKNN